MRWKVEGPENVDALQFIDANGWYITLNNYKDIAYGEMDAKPKAKFD